MRGHCGVCSTCWSGDDPGSLGVRVWLAVGRTDMRRGMNGLALQIQEALRRDPHAGDLYVFRGARGDLIKFFGMTASACRSTPKGWRRAVHLASPADGVSRSRPRNWPTCLTGLIGGTRFIPPAGACGIIADVAFFRSWQPGFVILSWHRFSPGALPDDIDALKAALVAERGERIAEAAGRHMPKRNSRWRTPRPPTIKR